MKLTNILKTTLWLALLATQSAYSEPQSGEGTQDTRSDKKNEAHEALIPTLNPRYFITITPELLKKAESSPGSRPAENDPAGHWGAPWEGVQLSIRLPKEAYTNGEPILACVTLRNTSFKVRAFRTVSSLKERDTKLTVMRGQERMLGEDDPKPWETFQERLRHLKAGSMHDVSLLPGTQYQFVYDLREIFDLKLAGTYSVQAQREVVSYNDAPDRPGYVTGSFTNIQSGTATFRIVEKDGSK
ncbi:MAG TPA: hypothetical protein VEC99_16625 [Clostridia bacterium]|nr:hypothetical protein [Clostridia bacterium]